MDLSLSARLAVGIALAAGLAYATTPVAILAARRFSLYDRPAAAKLHKSPTPYLGGAAVMLAFSIALLVGAGDARRTLPLLVGVAILLVVGTIDDKVTVSPSTRVIIELGLGAMLAIAGLGWKLGAGLPLDMAISGVWVVAVVNAFNLFDNMDGQASTMALVVSAGACALAIDTGANWAAAGSAALCGACAGFLPHNLHKPAKIFLGDGGSMPLGFAVAALVAVAARSAEPSTLALVVGVGLVGLPALDTSLVIVSRRRRGVSFLTAGQDHLTHRAGRAVGTPKRVALVLGSGQALVSALVIFATRNSPVALVYAMLGFVVCAATAIAALESVEQAPAAVLAHPGGIAPAPAVARAQRGDGYAELAVLLTLGAGAGLSPIFEGYYDTGTWTPIGLVLVVAAAVAAIARAPKLGRPAAFALSGVAGLGVWSLISTAWSPAIEQGTLDGNRWLVYAAMLLLALVLVRGRRQAAVLLIGAAAGIGLDAAWVLGHLLAAGGPSQFLVGRLNLPLGYINGQGCVFAMGCWPALALAERRSAWQAGAGAALAVAFACLALLSESRGAALASVAAVAFAMLAIPGRPRRTFALAFIAAGIAAAASDVVHVYSASGGGAPPASAVQSAAVATLLAALGAGLAWGLAVYLTGLAARRADEARTHLLHRAATAGAIALVAIPALAGIAKVGSIEHRISSQWHAFVSLSDATATASSGSQSRLFSGSGNRYDYWRIAAHLFTAHPIAGGGAGGYTDSYFLQRRTTEAIQNPHSIELEVLAELGLVGAALLAMVIGGIAFAARRLRRASLSSPAARALMVAASGMAVTWLVDTSGDWMHLLPGVTAIAVAAAAVLCGAGVTDAGEPAARPRGGARADRIRIFATAAVAFVLAIAGASLMRTGLANIYLSSAQRDLPNNPQAALTNANRSLRLDGANLDAYYAKAAAQARFDQAGAATETLLQATRADPGNFVTWILLGDLHVRVGDLPAARRYYGQAHHLDPHDPQVAALAANPAGQ